MFVIGFFIIIIYGTHSSVHVCMEIILIILNMLLCTCIMCVSLLTLLSNQSFMGKIIAIY